MSAYMTARERCMRVTRVCVFNMSRECDTCIRCFDGGSICTHINIKDDFREEKMRACMRLYVCTEDGGAGRKRGGDSVCEKRKKTQI